ncbi:MAG: XdhC family protein [Candidatus Tectomicrobia bacterium]|uniref:XdhC family protein n=1 Tax=Tectimicrobiota bacterium TaxID=2528274 RepID=A0A932CPQ1_UNCTE|nr:XdhC family protein [Candidatus Tectomicrobia bacterium]
MGEEEIYRRIASLREVDKGAVLATIVSKRGSAPRELGAKLLVEEGGATLGSISGGCVEAETWQEAMQMMPGGHPRIRCFHLTEKDAVESGLICGGALEVYLEPVSPVPQTAKGDLYQEIIALQSRQEKGALATLLLEADPSRQEGDAGGPPDDPRVAPIGERKQLFGREGLVAGARGEDQAWEHEVAEMACQVMAEERPRLLELPGGPRVFLDPIVASPILYLFGGGHISLPLARLGKMSGFQVIVVDDRELYANSTRFPEANRVYAREFTEVLPELVPHSSSYIVIVTRGHLHDELVLEWAVKQTVRYIGMIGSRQKIRRIYTNLTERGTPPEALARVHSPIGLSIGAETPEEIAVSIAAQLIQVRRERTP